MLRAIVITQLICFLGACATTDTVPTASRDTERELGVFHSDVEVAAYCLVVTYELVNFNDQHHRIEFRDWVDQEREKWRSEFGRLTGDNRAYTNEFVWGWRQLFREWPGLEAYSIDNLPALLWGCKEILEDGYPKTYPQSVRSVVKMSIPEGARH